MVPKCLVRRRFEESTPISPDQCLKYLSVDVSNFDSFWSEGIKSTMMAAAYIQSLPDHTPLTAMEHRPDSSGSPEIPMPVRAILWEYDAETLDWTTDRDLIIGRVISRGTWDNISWLRDQLGDDALRDWIDVHEGGDLSPRQLRFWEIIVDLPSRRVDAWVTRRRSSIWEGRVSQ